MRKHSNQIEQPDLVEQIRLDLIPSTYPKEFEAICKLRSLRKKQDILDHLKLSLADIVTQYRRRFLDKRYFASIAECIQFANTAPDGLQAIVDRLGKLDGTHIQTLWAAASYIDPNGFTERDYMELLKQLSSMIQTMKLLTVALPFATGVSGKKRGRGRPPKPYFEAAKEMISLWEIITAEPKPPPYNPDVFFIEAVKTAKKEVKKDEPDIVASKDSTEFCRLVFRMVDPNITLPQVRTAINKARKAREMWWQFLDSASSSRSKESLALRYCRFLQKQSQKRKRRVRK